LALLFLFGTADDVSPRGVNQSLKVFGHFRVPPIPGYRLITANVTRHYF